LEGSAAGGGGGRTWWYHGYPAHDAVRVATQARVAVAFGAAWAVTADGLARVDVRTEKVRRVAQTADVAPAAAAGRVWLVREASLVALDPRTRAVVRRVALPARAGPFGVRRPTVLAAAGDTLWSANGDAVAADLPGRLWEVDARRGRVVASIRLPDQTVALAGARGRAWAGQERGDVLELAGGRVVARTRLDGYPVIGLAATRDGVWAETARAVYRLRGGRIVTRLAAPASGFAGGIAVGGRWLWVVRGDGRLQRVDARTLRPQRALAIGGAGAPALGAGAVWLPHGETLWRVSTRGPWDARPRAPWCRASQLRASDEFQGATQSLLGGISLRNRSHRACTLSGHARVRAADARGRAIPLVVDAATPRFEFGTPPRNWPYVTLAPGRTAGFDAQWWNACTRGGRVFRIGLRRGGGDVVLRSRFGGGTCVDPTRPESITIGPFGASLGS
jgi:hypothetical protein